MMHIGMCYAWRIVQSGTLALSVGLCHALPSTELVVFVKVLTC